MLARERISSVPGLALFPGDAKAFHCVSFPRREGDVKKSWWKGCGGGVLDVWQ